MAKAEASVEDLVGMIDRKELRLPEMQRRYVWRSTRVRDLLDSLYRGYPSGSILVWETDESVQTQDFAIEQQKSAINNKGLLLDGQQRLTSLMAVIQGKPVNVRGRKRPIEILFNLEHPQKPTFVTEVDEDGDNENDEDEIENMIEDEIDSNEDEMQKRFDQMTFVVSTRKLEQLPHWVKVTDVFKTDTDRPFLKRAGINDLDDPRGEKYSQRLAQLRGIRKYVYRMDVLERSFSYDEVTEIFVRVNSLGAKLRSSDLALAQITAKWRGALKIFQDFQSQCTKAGFDLDLGLHLKNLVAFATGQSRFLTVGKLSMENLQRAWIECVPGMEFAINFLKNNVNIDIPLLLSSPFILVTLSYYGHKRNYNITKDEEKQLRYWTMIANAKGRYSRGSTETLLDQDLAILRQNGGTKELIDRLRLQVGRLDIVPEELKGRNQRSALFKTMFLAFRAAGAKDWSSSLGHALNHQGAKHHLEYHHIFPKATLKGICTRNEIDDIANLCFISSKTNKIISNKAPRDYMPEMIKNADIAAFEAQCIPTDASLRGIENYKDFLQERRKLIAKRLNDYISESLT